MTERQVMQDYRGNTFVGYLDISGFKQMMFENRTKAEDVLNCFYETIYGSVEVANFENATPVKFNAIVVSDCAVLFLSRKDNGGYGDIDQTEGLSMIPQNVQSINLAFINRCPQPFMTTCSIAYGRFEYENRKELSFIRKNCIKGQAYMEAYSDSESNEPRMQPGESRILERRLNVTLDDDALFSLLNSRPKYYYFYWMLPDKRSIKTYDMKYKEVKEKMYASLIQLIQHPCQTNANS